VAAALMAATLVAAALVAAALVAAALSMSRWVQQPAQLSSAQLGPGVPLAYLAAGDCVDGGAQLHEAPTDGPGLGASAQPACCEGSLAKRWRSWRSWAELGGAGRSWAERWRSAGGALAERGGALAERWRSAGGAWRSAGGALAERGSEIFRKRLAPLWPVAIIACHPVPGLTPL
jgi:hypothetical protein